MMKETIFREYDIRGLVNKELMIDDVYDLGRAIAFYLVQLNDKVKKIVVGMDVTFVGLCSSPMIYFATYTMPVDAAVMITASHNPKEYNGLKVCLGTHSLWGAQIKELGKLYFAKKSLPDTKHGTYQEHIIKDDYIAWHAKKFENLKGSDIAAVIDCGNGAAGVVLPDIVKTMQWKNIQLLCAEVDGNFPNHEADPTHIKNMQ